MAVAEHHGHDHGTTSVQLAPRPDGSDRVAAVQRARWLNAATIGWNAIEGVVAVTAGLAAGSVSLVAFGFDSAIEVSAALVLTWRLHQERKGGCMQTSDRRATRVIAVSFVVLGVYVGVESIRDLLGGAAGLEHGRDRHGRPLVAGHAVPGSSQAGPGSGAGVGRRRG